MRFLPIHAAFICAALVATEANLCGQPASPAPATPLGPKMVFLTNEYQFGKVMAGEQVRYVFIVSNAGDQTLVISNVAPGCHCTTAGNWAHQVEPGKTGEIPIKFDSGSFRGDVTKAIMVTSNSKLTPNQTLMLRGSIQKAIEISPQFAYMVVMPDAPSNATTVVHITGQIDQPITLSEPTSANSSFKAELKTIKPGKDFEVLITALPPLHTGNNSGTISIKTSLTNMPVLSINVAAMVQPSLSVVPPQITLMPQVNGWITNHVTIAANGSKALALSDPEVSDPKISVELKETSPGRAFQVTTVFPPGYQIASGQSVQLSVKSNNPDRPVIVVPIRQYPRQPVMSAPLAHPKAMSQNPPPVPTTGQP